jgi:predicted DNA binding protein
MSDYLKTFVDDDPKSGISFIDNHKPRGTVGTPAVAPTLSRESFINKDDSLHVQYQYKKGDPIEEIIVPRLKKSLNTILGKSTILYGPTKTGKTVITLDFMYLMRHIFPFVFVFSPTGNETKDYEGIIPKALIYNDFGLKHIKAIYDRQKAASSIYREANELKVLNTLFMRIASAPAKMFLKRILTLKSKAIAEAESKCQTLGDKKKKRDEIEEIFSEKLIKFYKQVINPNAKRLESMNLTPEEKNALKYRNFNPRVLIIFDDAMTEIMKLIREGHKKEDEVIKNFFFRGRHAFITHVYTFQDDKNLDSDIRKNAFISVFTNKTVALSFFQRSANNFSAQERKRAEAIIESVFSTENDAKFYKLIYSRMDKVKFQYIIGEEHEKFDMCSSVVRNYCNKIETKGSNIDSNNPFFNKFKPD